MSRPEREQRTVVVFLRDRERGLGTGYKTRAEWIGGEFDDSPWRQGEFRCDSVRGRMLYNGGEYPAGETRFTIERIVVWDTGETVYSETGDY